MSDKPRIEFRTKGKSVSRRVIGSLPKVDWEIDKDFIPGPEYKPVTSNKKRKGAE